MPTCLFVSVQERDDAREVIRLSVEKIKQLRAEHREKQEQWWQGEQAWREQRARDKVPLLFWLPRSCLQPCFPNVCLSNAIRCSAQSCPDIATIAAGHLSH